MEEAMAKLLIMALLVAAASAAPTSPSLPSYVNHTVGGPAGWFFNATTNTTSADFTSWAANKTFNLGDYLIFNTNTNHSVIQTYNQTTYKSCSTDNASDNDTFQYTGGQQDLGVPETVLVPLTLQGPNYYFSDAGDGVECLNGMGFEIVVDQGRGLPPSLSQPPPPPYTEPSDNTTTSPPVPTGVGSNQGETFYNGGGSMAVTLLSLGILAFSFLFSVC